MHLQLLWNAVKDPPITDDLNLTLEAILTGERFRKQYTRRVITETGDVVEREETFLVEIPRGATEGANYTVLSPYRKWVTSLPVTFRRTLSSSSSYKPHPTFTVQGQHLERQPTRGNDWGERCQNETDSNCRTRPSQGRLSKGTGRSYCAIWNCSR